MAGDEVLIVGAGPTGLVTALLLARLGVASTVVERSRGPAALPRAVHLDDEGRRILQRVGIAEEFARISRPAAGLRLLDARLRPFATFPRDGPGLHGHPRSTLFDQPALERLLRTAVAARPEVTLRNGTEVVDLDRSGLVTVSDGRTTHEQVRPPLVLGCDGAASTVRRAVGVGWRELGAAQRWFVVDARVELLREDRAWGGVDQVCDPRRAATSMALPGGRHRWEFRMRPGESAEQLRIALPALVARWGVRDLDVLRASEYTFRARVAFRWRVGAVLLMGDAAHQTPPFIGQGLGAGLRDAHNLAWKVAAVLAGSADDTLLDSYAAERAPHVIAQIRGAVRVGRAMTGGGGVAAALRRPVAGLLLRVPAVRERAARDLLPRCPPGPTVDRHALAGRPCPQPTVEHDGRRTPLDEMLGDGWALVTIGDPPSALAERARRHCARVVAVPELSPWLGEGRATAALLRPDRVVAAAA